MDETIRGPVGKQPKTTASVPTTPTTPTPSPATPTPGPSPFVGNKVAPTPQSTAATTVGFGSMAAAGLNSQLFAPADDGPGIPGATASPPTPPAPPPPPPPPVVPTTPTPAPAPPKAAGPTPETRAASAAATAFLGMKFPGDVVLFRTEGCKALDLIEQAMQKETLDDQRVSLTRYAKDVHKHLAQLIAMAQTANGRPHVSDLGAATTLYSELRQLAAHPAFQLSEATIHEIANTLASKVAGETISEELANICGQHLTLTKLDDKLFDFSTRVLGRISKLLENQEPETVGELKTQVNHLLSRLQHPPTASVPTPTPVPAPTPTPAPAPTVDPFSTPTLPNGSATVVAATPSPVPAPVVQAVFVPIGPVNPATPSGGSVDFEAATPVVPPAVFVPVGASTTTAQPHPQTPGQLTSGQREADRQIALAEIMRNNSPTYFASRSETEIDEMLSSLDSIVRSPDQTIDLKRRAEAEHLHGLLTKRHNNAKAKRANGVQTVILPKATVVPPVRSGTGSSAAPSSPQNIAPQAQTQPMNTTDSGQKFVAVFVGLGLFAVAAIVFLLVASWTKENYEPDFVWPWDSPSWTGHDASPAPVTVEPTAPPPVTPIVPVQPAPPSVLPTAPTPAPVVSQCRPVTTEDLGQNPRSVDSARARRDGKLPILNGLRCGDGAIRVNRDQTVDVSRCERCP